MCPATQRLVVAVLTVCGGALPLGALIVGGCRVWREHRDIASKLDRVQALRLPQGTTDEDYAAAQEAILSHTMTITQAEYGHEWVRRHILRDTLDDLRGPALAAGAGVVLATVASLWGLFLPPA